MNLKTGPPATKPERNLFAYVVALFIPGGNLGGGCGGPLVAAMMMVVMICLLAAMAIPAFQKVREASHEKACANNLRQYAAAFDQYTLENSHPPKNLDELIGPKNYLKAPLVCLQGGTYDIPEGADTGDEIACSKHGTFEELSAAHGAPAQRR